MRWAPEGITPPDGEPSRETRQEVVVERGLWSSLHTHFHADAAWAMLDSGVWVPDTGTQALGRFVVAKVVFQVSHTECACCLKQCV